MGALLAMAAVLFALTAQLLLSHAAPSAEYCDPGAGGAGNCVNMGNPGWYSNGADTATGGAY